jgi:hypothetical protein
MTSPLPMNPGGATWCEGHGRFECTKTSKRSHERCHSWAIRGTAACRNHSGKRLAVAKAQGEAITAWSAFAGLATVTTTEAVLGMLQMSWLRAHLYATLLEEQVAQVRAQSGGLPALDGEEEGDGGGQVRGAVPVGPGVGLVGHTFGAVKDIGIYATGEAARGLTMLEAAERDRCVRFAKTAHDMGIAEHQVRLAEQQGQMIAEVIQRVLATLDLSAAQRSLAFEVLPRELRAVGGLVA